MGVIILGKKKLSPDLLVSQLNPKVSIFTDYLIINDTTLKSFIFYYFLYHSSVYSAT